MPDQDQDARELIPIREAARRLGVSDTAVHKALKAGRVSLAGRHPTNNRPLVAWPAVRDDWHANSDSKKRSQVGPKGNSPRRASFGGNTPPENPLPTSADLDKAPADEAGIDLDGTPTFAQARAVREAYQARLAKLEYEERSGKLIATEQVNRSAFKVARAVRDGLMNLPDRLAAELAAESDAAAIHSRLAREIRDVLRELTGTVSALDTADATADA